MSGLERDQQYGDESMQLQVLQAEAARLKAEYQRKDLVIVDMKSELAAAQDDSKRISQELVASRASNQEKADLIGKKEGQLEERERDYKLRVQTLQHEHSAGTQALEKLQPSQPSTRSKCWCWRAVIVRYKPARPALPELLWPSRRRARIRRRRRRAAAPEEEMEYAHVSTRSARGPRRPGRP